MTRLAIALGYAISILVLAALAAPSALAEGAGLHGRVFALDDKGDLQDVVVGAEIQFLDASGAVVARVTSKTGGYYRVNLPAGTYHYKVTATGFKDEDVKRGVRQELTAGFSVFDFALTPGKEEAEDTPQDAPEDGDDDAPPGGTTIPAEIGTLYGVVHERSDEGPLTGISGALVRLARDDGEGNTQVRTDGSGAYEIMLSTGSWHATAYAPGFEPFVDAQAIQIAKGRRTNRDFLFVRPRPPAVQKGQGIRGTVRLLADPDASPRTAPTPTVSILPLTPKATQGAAPGVDAQGAFQSDLAVGRYDVVASATGYETAHSGPRGVHAGRSTHVDLTLRPSPSQPQPAPTPPDRMPTPTPDPSPDPAPLPAGDPPPDPTPKPQPTPADRGSVLSLQVLERGPGRILRIAVGATVTTRRETGEADERTTDADGWCTLALAPGTQSVEVRGGGGATATLGVGLAPAERLVEVVRNDATGTSHLELRLPVAVQVVLGPEETPESHPGGGDPEEIDPRPTARIQVRVVETGPGGRGKRPIHGARVRILLGEDVADTGTTEQGAFTSKLLPIVPGYYAVVDKPGYHMAEKITPIEPPGLYTVILDRMGSREYEPVEPPDREPPPGEGPDDVESAELTVRVLGPEDRPIRGALVEVHWGAEELNDIRARGVTAGRDPLFRATVRRESYWVTAQVEIPGRGTVRGVEGVPADWNPEDPVIVRLDVPEGPGPGEPAAPSPGSPPGRAQPAPLQIQVLGPDGRPLAGAQVVVLWGPQGRSQVRGRAATQGRQGIARFNLPREDYAARAVAQLPGGSRLVGEVGVGRAWNPAVPIRIRLHQEGGAQPPPHQPPPHQPGPNPPRPPTQKPPATKATLTVRVTGLDLNAPISTLQPLGGARVTVRGNGGSWSGTTNGGGAWSVGLAPGSYQIEVTANGMERAANASVNMGAKNVTRELTIKLRGPR